ncbi:hypothetical protein EJ05DRAFT_506716 [Pseudovirgaria hyperparasitica]|uniref:Uncharacterized protein n=1 Tax=Pseudovirgaria hyperparasitica TaxID=470096 RepID=A0A6A6WLP7_9PEZI|nr:uncharacterized protein EJ05DRAFT_506716 [Pseudovirgaria hyperparasitica]KAF2763078.1 hypothetical protein EJ05DRAFT_506716 [Pseudovirgaria hyperparasitica]
MRNDEDMVFVDAINTPYDDGCQLSTERKTRNGIDTAYLYTPQTKGSIDTGTPRNNELNDTHASATTESPHTAFKSTRPIVSLASKDKQDEETLQTSMRPNTTIVKTTQEPAATLSHEPKITKAHSAPGPVPNANLARTAPKSSMPVSANQAPTPLVHRNPPAFPPKNLRPCKSPYIPPPPPQGAPLRSSLPPGMVPFEHVGGMHPIPTDPLNGSEIITSHSELIPVVYTDDNKPEDKLVRTIFNKRIYTTFHHAGSYDFAKHSSLLRAAETEVWYRWPAASDESHILSLCKRGELASATEYLSTEVEGRSISPLNASIPRVWASHVFTAPLDDDVYTCVTRMGHLARNYSGACTTCTHTVAKKLENTSLVYIVVLSSYMDPAPGFSARGPSPTEKVFKVLSFGSRESAAAEAFYASGVQGWDVVFSCVIRSDALSALGKGLDVVRVEKIHELANVDEREIGGDYVRAFY